MSARTAFLAVVAASATAHPRGCDADQVAVDDVDGASTGLR
jgi:hypothetical protein